MVDWTYAVAFLWEIHEKAMRKPWDIREVNQIPKQSPWSQSFGGPGAQNKKQIIKFEAIQLKAVCMANGTHAMANPWEILKEIGGIPLQSFYFSFINH